MQEFNIAVVGATGAVGQEILKVLDERNFPVAELKLLASSRSEGKKIRYRDRELTVHETTADSFGGVDIALFAGGEASRQFGRAAAAAGAVVIDNSSTFRMEPDVPLVVPEVNPEDVRWHKGLIANPNCSTIIMVVALKPVYDAAGIKRVVVSTYQAVSGAGKEAIDELDLQTRQLMSGEPVTPKVFPYQIGFNLIPHIDIFLGDGYTKEEMKMVNETRKIMHDESMAITATTVRVPVFRSHSESINIETNRKMGTEEAKAVLSRAPGVVVVDDPGNKLYPMPVPASERDEVFVGRIREDFSVSYGLNLWVVSDQLRKGAATNAVQIAEILVRENLVKGVSA